MSALVSIAICTYNGEEFLIKQLESLVNQTYSELEIIAVDDASSDQTLQILKSYEQRYSFFKVYKNTTNLGYVKNFEKALKLCTGEYIALSDHDDIWELDKIEILVNNIHDHLLIYHNSDFIDENDQQLADITVRDHYKHHEGDSNLPFLISNCIPGHAMLFHKSLLGHIFPFDKDFHHDWWIAFIAATLGKISSIPDVLVHYRQHGRNITDTLKLQQRPESEKHPVLYFDLKWIERCLNFNNPKNPEEILYIYQQLSAFQQHKTGLKLFLFMARYYDRLFYFTTKQKSYLSNLNRLRKICFSKKNRV